MARPSCSVHNSCLTRLIPGNAIVSMGKQGVRYNKAIPSLPFCSTPAFSEENPARLNIQKSTASATG
jgi:hypothetical protein